MDIRSRGETGVIAESRDVVRKKAEVEVLPVVDLSEESASFFFGRWNTGDNAKSQNFVQTHPIPLKSETATRKNPVRAREKKKMV